ncbi:hypothetical protein C8R30_1537 [Nitrosomonas nitrosa]|uniref:hypothetical protein n=1 Tax=Nitrosomonas nitrosa TaxID=52442 RepID=UPI000D31E09B|nr:hypothetical protein [Nitrosomonas nitrosa]PTQ88350.1 hypothetical protein C8R30_1537 [Nitrosomonas nitrosa]
MFKSTDQLASLKTSAESALARIGNKIAGAEQKINTLQNESQQKYQREYLNKQVADLRAQVSDTLYEDYKKIIEAKDMALAAERFYKKTSFMLSRAQFNADPATNANMKLTVMNELERMSSDDVIMTAEVAKAENKLALFWCCYLQGTKTPLTGAMDALTLDGIRTQEQVYGLELIDGIKKLFAHAELKMKGSVISPTPLQPRDKLRLAREAGIP